jgi:hypothetical protein
MSEFLIEEVESQLHEGLVFYYLQLPGLPVMTAASWPGGPSADEAKAEIMRQVVQDLFIQA